MHHIRRMARPLIVGVAEAYAAVTLNVVGGGFSLKRMAQAESKVSVTRSPSKPKPAGIVESEVKATVETPIVWRGTKVENGKTTVTNIGAFGEHIAEDMLAKNGWSNFTYIKNGSDNGIDIIARGPKGQLGFFEVKTSSTGEVPNLSARQTNMNYFVEDVLYKAKEGLGPYKNIDQETKNAAANIYKEFKSQPSNVSGNIIGIDLKSGTIKISSWEK